MGENPTTLMGGAMLIDLKDRVDWFISKNVVVQGVEKLIRHMMYVIMYINSLDQTFSMLICFQFLMTTRYERILASLLCCPKKILATLDYIVVKVSNDSFEEPIFILYPCT